MLTISGLTYRVGGRHGRALFNEANAQIPEGSKLGLVGRNGAGKSTLLDLIRGRLLPDQGDVVVPRGHRIGFLAQEAPGGSGNPLDTVLAADRERGRLLAELDDLVADECPSPLRIAEIEDRLDTIGARAAPARAARILAGLGLEGHGTSRAAREGLLRRGLQRAVEGEGDDRAGEHHTARDGHEGEDHLLL
jgi:ATP-binding cassette subfamily F protein 3